MIPVPVGTVEKPITVIDYIAHLDACRTHAEVADYAERCPMAVRKDERFERAVLAKLDAIKAKRPNRSKAA